VTNQKKLSTWQTIGLGALLLIFPTAGIVGFCWLFGVNPWLFAQKLARVWERLEWENILSQALSKLGAWLLVFVAYQISYVSVGVMRKGSKFWNSRTGKFLAYPCFLFWVAVVSLFDPTGKTNEDVATTFFVIAAPAMVAVYRHYKKNPREGDAQ
jgi:hypothetical protein